MPEQLLVADWSKEVGKRVAYHVDVVGRAIRRTDPPAGGWTIQGLVDAASQHGNSVMVLIDVAIGLPAGLFKAMRDLSGESAKGHFLNFLRDHLSGEWLGDVQFHGDWSIRSPYMHVPKGDGSLTEFKNKAAEFGVCLRRAIDLEAGGRSPLILSGIPGTVGSGSRQVIRALGGLDENKVAIWPFDGPLAALLGSTRVIIGEIYPRALYGHALLDAPSDQRGLIALGKTKGEIRAAAITHLQSLQWHRVLDIELEPSLIQRACNNEDDFDSYLSALGILRLLLEKISLEDESLQLRMCEQGRPLLDSIAEGGMLGVLATQLDVKQCTFAARPTTKTNRGSESGATMSQLGTRGSRVRVTRKSIENVANHVNNRQISFSALAEGSKHSPVWVEIECEGRSYTLTISDTTSCWRVHQISTAEDFDSLYDLLCSSSDEWRSVELVEVRLLADNEFAEHG